MSEFGKISAGEFHLPDADVLRRFRWVRIENDSVREALIEEERTLRFAIAMVKKAARDWLAGERSSTDLTSWQCTVFNGHMRQVIGLAGSVIEGCLWDHAFQRGYKKPNPNHLSFGGAISAWHRLAGPRPAELKEIWWFIKEIKDLRDQVHLFKRAEDPRSVPTWLADNHQRLIANVDRVLTGLHGLNSGKAS